MFAFWTGTRPRVVGVSPSIVPFLHSKRTAAARSLVSLIESERFVAVLSELAVELPASRGSVLDPATARGARDYVYERWIRTRDT